MFVIVQLWHVIVIVQLLHVFVYVQRRHVFLCATVSCDVMYIVDV